MNFCVCDLYVLENAAVKEGRLHRQLYGPGLRRASVEDSDRQVNVRVQVTRGDCNVHWLESEQHVVHLARRVA